MSTVQHLCAGKAIYSGVRSQAIGNDTSEEPCQYSPQDCSRMILQLQRYDVTIRYRSGKEMLLTDALSRCPTRASGEIKLDMRVDYIAFSKTWIAQTQGCHQGRPHSWHSLPAHSAGVATSKEAYSQNGQGVLRLQRPALYRQGTAPDGPQNCHSVLPS